MRINTLTVRSLAAVGLTAAAAAISASPAAAQAPTTLSFKELERGSTFTFVDSAPRSQRRNGMPTRTSPGDLFLFSNPLRDAAGNPFGRLSVTCFVTTSGRTSRTKADCLGVYAFPTGSVFAAAQISFASQAPTTGTVFGGTGAYANARGTFTSTETRTDTDTTMTLVP
jgi:hypothetical protein